MLSELACLHVSRWALLLLRSFYEFSALFATLFLIALALRDWNKIRRTPCFDLWIFVPHTFLQNNVLTSARSEEFVWNKVFFAGENILSSTNVYEGKSSEKDWSFQSLVLSLQLGRSYPERKTCPIKATHLLRNDQTHTCIMSRFFVRCETTRGICSCADARVGKRLNFPPYISL